MTSNVFEVLFKLQNYTNVFIYSRIIQIQTLNYTNVAKTRAQSEPGRAQTRPGLWCKWLNRHRLYANAELTLIRAHFTSDTLVLQLFFVLFLERENELETVQQFKGLVTRAKMWTLRTPPKVPE